MAETDFVWEEQVVYHQLNKSESLAWGLFKDGMRSLTIHRGAEEEELPRFLETINQARFLPADAGDDLLTLLWEQEFQLIQYHFIEFFGEGGGDLPEQTGTYAGGGNAEEAARPSGRRQAAEEAPPRPKGVVDLEDFDSTLYFLDENEINYVAAGAGGGISARRPRVAASTCCSTCSRSRASRRSGTRSSASSSSCSPTFSTRAISGRRPRCSASASVLAQRAPGLRRSTSSGSTGSSPS